MIPLQKLMYSYNIYLCLSLLSVPVVKSITKNDLEMKVFIWLIWSQSIEWGKKSQELKVEA